MAEYPCLPLWTDAYLADTAHLSTEEHGAYLLLLIQAWRMPDCSLPNDDALLAKHAKLSASRWAKAKSVVMSFWVLDDERNRWVQKRLSKERGKTIERSAKAKESADKRWDHQRRNDANAYANASPEQCYPKPLTSNERSNDLSSGAKARKKSDHQYLLEAFNDV